MTAADWTHWRRLQPAVSFSERSLAETLDGGQAFRWSREEGNVWRGHWGKCLAKVRLNSENELEWSSPVKLGRRVGREIPVYFAAATPFHEACETLPWRSDKPLSKAMKKWRGLRLLKQPPGETLLAFLCSSNKQIRQIRQICEAIAQRFGEKLWENCYSLPSWDRLHGIPEKELRNCKAGYRARFIRESAASLHRNPRFFKELDALPYPEAREKLMTLPGVGEKIADCVLLFGMGRMEAFPVDVWVLKAMSRHYGLKDWKRDRIAQFGRAHFGKYAGLAQQFLFAGERNNRHPNRP